MTDREKLIELIDMAEDVAEEHCWTEDSCKTCGKKTKDGDKCCTGMMADILIANGVTVQRWIPVTERLPEGGSYLVCKSGYGGTRYLDVLSFVEDLYRLDEYDFHHYKGQKKAGFVYYDSEYGYYEVDSVTHWMPLPEMPKEGE